LSENCYKVKKRNAIVLECYDQERVPFFMI
jgi:hypothetical protein